jgi:hypothetical protein
MSDGKGRGGEERDGNEDLDIGSSFHSGMQPLRLHAPLLSTILLIKDDDD